MEFMSGMPPPRKGFRSGLVEEGVGAEDGAEAGEGTEGEGTDDPAATAAAFGTARIAAPLTMWIVWLSSNPYEARLNASKVR